LSSFLQEFYMRRSIQAGGTPNLNLRMIAGYEYVYEPMIAGCGYVYKPNDSQTLKDIDKLTKGIELVKHEDVWSVMTSEKRSVKSGSLGSMAMDTPNLVDTMNIDEPPNVHSVSIQEKPSSYVGAAGGSKLIPS
nr:hypothetical protein [Tanacetum cinerariifolium]